jgi:hypothetical protein
VNEERLDLSAVDPSGDKEHWERLIQNIVRRAREARRQPLTIGYQLIYWARPILTIAAAATLVVWIGALVSKHLYSTAHAAEEPAFVIASWAMAEELPSTAKMLEVLGGYHAAN